MSAAPERPSSGPIELPKPKGASVFSRLLRGRHAIAALLGLGGALYGGGKLMEDHARLDETNQRRGELRAKLDADVAGRADGRLKNLQPVDVSQASLEADMQKLLADNVISPDEVSQVRIVSYRRELLKIHQRGASLDALSKADPNHKVALPPEVEADLTGELLPNLRQHPQPKIMWQGIMKVLNESEKADEVQSALAQARRLIVDDYRRFYSADLALAIGQGLGIEVRPRALQRLAIAEREQWEKMVPELHAQVAYEQAMTGTIGTLQSAKRLYDTAKTQMTTAGLTPRAIPLLEAETEAQLKAIEGVRKEEALIETVSRLRDASQTDPRLREAYAKARDEFYATRGGTPLPERIALDLQARRAAQTDQLLGTLHYPSKYLIEAEVLIRRAGWAISDRADGRQLQMDIEQFMKVTEEEGKKNPDVQKARDLVKQLLDCRDLDKVRTLHEQMPRERVRVIMETAEMYEDWARQLAESFKNPQQLPARAAELKTARSQCMEGVHLLTIQLLDLQQEYMRDGSGFDAVRTGFQTKDAPSNRVIVGTSASGLDAALRQELLVRRLPEIRAALAGIRSNTAIRGSDRTRDYTAKIVVEPLRRLMRVAETLQGGAVQKTERTLKMTQIMGSYNMQPVDDMERDLALLEESQADPRMQTAALSRARQNHSAVEIAAHAKTLIGVTSSDAMRTILNGSDLDRLAFAQILQERLHGHINSLDAEEGKLLLALSEYGNENTDIVTEMVRSGNNWLWLALAVGGGAFGIWMAARGIRRAIETRRIAGVSSRETYAALTPVIAQVNQRIAELQGNDEENRRLLTEALAELRAATQPLATEIDAGDTTPGVTVEPSLRELYTQLQLAISQLGARVQQLEAQQPKPEPPVEDASHI